MISVKKYIHFADAKRDWENLEETVFHYPFQCFWYHELFAKTFCNELSTHVLGVFESNKLLAIGSFEEFKNKTIFVGMRPISTVSSLSDYGDLLWSNKGKENAKSVWEAILSYAREQNLPPLQLDFVRQDCPTYEVFQDNRNAVLKIDEVAPFLKLPNSFEEYVEKLDHKKRHELRRKLRRFPKNEAIFQYMTDSNYSFEEFIRLHKLSDPHKFAFMTEEVKSFFHAVAFIPKKHWRVEFCSLAFNGKIVASTMYYMNDSYSLLYNSGYDPAFHYMSVGLVLQAHMIEKAINGKKTTYDFLRGNERYKYDLGGVDIPLFKIQVG